MIKVFIPQLPPKALSPNFRGHWAVRARAVKEYREFVRLTCLDAKVVSSSPEEWKIIEKAILYITFRFRQRRGRDVDNYIGSSTPLINGLVDAGLIKADDFEHLHIGGIEMDYQAKNEGVEISILGCIPELKISPRSEVLNFIVESCRKHNDCWNKECPLEHDCRRFYDYKI